MNKTEYLGYFVKGLLNGKGLLTYQDGRGY